MDYNYVFDVDGTLTPSRGLMDLKFKDFFQQFILHNDVYLVTGSDYEKTVEQVGVGICESVNTCFNCSGNSIWIAGQNISNSNWKLEQFHKDFLERVLKNNQYPLRFGNHIEERLGLVNFSVVGRNADQENRKLYNTWDSEHNSRELIAEEINRRFEDIEAQVAGEIGIDIVERGKDKRQILNHINGPTLFFGDTIYPGGNDYSLAEALKDRKYGFSHLIKDWKETKTYLKRISFNLQEFLNSV
tara:strand:+ start:1518 stop:2249 length:732 start_codon:yes stop_codon:yes gene_type:complete